MILVNLGDGGGEGWEGGEAGGEAGVYQKSYMAGVFSATARPFIG